ncbi:hypothetical protein FALBO_13782 [Fusarium albosuccineum]|uniref:DNA repair protein Rad26 n=1 Tax=Fusarium albosuccineum TaxID=1237068 RepID=A0A8H4L0I2_9HYPO|nr:hypothetical protein FALBO_13782 [Fusarium albosuccineum]
MGLDEFSDDGLDDLPDNALQELEDNAIQLTQAHAQPRLPSQRHVNENPEVIWVEDDDLDTTEVTNDAGVPIGRPAKDNTLQQQNRSSQSQLHIESRRSIPPPNPRWNPVVDPSRRRPAGQAPSHLPNAGPPNQPLYTSQQFQTQSSNFPRAQPSQFARPPLPGNRFGPSQSSQNQPGDPLSALQQRVRALEAELSAARGEASIIRSNSVKTQQQHEAEVARLKRINAEQLARQERIAEAAVVAEQTANTELQFLQRDMREVNDRARRKDAPAGSAGGVTTPKKAAKSWRVADGFDEMDIVLSPSKGQGRNRNAGSVAISVGERTPSKGKRKRPAVDSPVMALETHTDSFDSISSKPEPPVEQAPVVVAAAPALPFEVGMTPSLVSSQANMIQFLQLLFDHGTFHNQPPTFDVLSRFSFASDPDTSFSAIIFQKIPLMGNPQKPMQLLVDFTNLMVSIWSRCLDEQLWEPIKYLVALISFTFSFHAAEVAPFVVPNLNPPAQATICSLGELRYRWQDGQPKSDQLLVVEQHINSIDVMSLLYTCSLACSTAWDELSPEFESKATIFWSNISLKTVLLLLTPKQELHDILGMLELLAAASLPGSIGPIVDDQDPPFIAQSVIDRVSGLLVGYPRPAMTRDEQRTLRLAVLRTLVSFTRYPFGALQLASHNTALPRLVTCLSNSIDELYNQPIPSNILPQTFKADGTRASDTTTPPSLYRIISQCVYLIHFLVTSPETADVANIGHKLSASHAGSHRYLLALGRLTFAEEDLVMEAGIDGETVWAANELLDLAVSPEEGEVMSEAFMS